MQKDELTPYQMSARTYFVDKVRQAGWNLRGYEALFEAGISLTPEASAEYQQDYFLLRLGFYMADDYLLLELQPHNPDPVFSVRFHPNDHLAAVLDALFAVQDTITPDNDVDSLAPAAALCAHVFVATPDGLEQIS